MTRTEITNSEDVIDSRDVIERVRELEVQDEWTEDEADELASLRRFVAEAEAAEDWEYGEVFVRESYFTEYAQELAGAIGAIDSNASWPMTCIDWEQAARELKMDYTIYDFDGVTYYAR